MLSSVPNFEGAAATGDEAGPPAQTEVVPKAAGLTRQGEKRSAGAPRIPALDGLRGIAILLVLLFHGLYNNHVDSKLVSIFLSLGRLSWSGVDLFLVLSGFLIGGILLDAKDSPRYFTTFYLRRAYRILPIYGVVVGIYSLRYLPVSVLHSWAGSAAIPFGAYPTFTQNFWMASRGTFGPVSMAVTWSLAVEEQFYLTAPLIVRRLSRKRLVYMLAAIVFLAPILRVLLVFTFHQDCLAAYVLMPCRADALCLGMLSAILVRDASRTAVSVRPETSPTGRDFLLCVPSPFAPDRSLSIHPGNSLPASRYTVPPCGRHCLALGRTTGHYVDSGSRPALVAIA